MKQITIFFLEDESPTLSKDAGHRPASLLKMSLFRRCFSDILLEKTKYLVFYISGTLVENGLTVRKKTDDFHLLPITTSRRKSMFYGESLFHRMIFLTRDS